MNIAKWIRVYYKKTTGSIAFYPALIAVGFLLLSWGMIEIDFSSWGKELKLGLSWLSLKDASTARAILSTVAGAIISLTVFSFSMVMIVLNQAASQMSNRVLTSMIENRFQQVTLGFYIGTIVYALFLLSTIRDISSGIYVPALSIYLLILLTVVDIFLFIYFLDYVTQTVKYETVIERVKNQTYRTMTKHYAADEDNEAKKVTWDRLPYREIKTDASNYFQSFDEAKLLNTAREKNIFISYLHQQSSFLVTGTVLARVYSSEPIDDACLEQIRAATDLYKGQPIAVNADYGFMQLAEIAIKALSPGINDPGTAVISLHALASLLTYRLNNHPSSSRADIKNDLRLYIPSSSFRELFEKCVYPIWNYGKHDAYIQNALLDILQQLKAADNKHLHTTLFDQLTARIEEERKSH